MFKFAVFLLLFFIGISVLRAVVAFVKQSLSATISGQIDGRPRDIVTPGGDLKRDPVCGTFVSPASALTRTVKGQVVYFCSNACRDRFRA